MAAVALLLLGLAASLPAAGATTAYVSSTPGTYRGQGTVSLMKALADQNVDRIELVGDYAAGDEFDPLQGAPFPINRCVTSNSQQQAAAACSMPWLGRITLAETACC